MKIVCEKEDLVKAINIVSKAVPVRTTMTILECILLDAGPHRLTLTASDTEMGIETNIRADVEEQGVVAVDAKMFSEIVRKLPDERVTISADERHNVEIRCGKAKFAIGGKEGEEFPELPELEKDEGITISEYTLKSVISDTIFCVAMNENNKIMTGELFEIRGDILRVVALDGHRIAMRRVALKGNFGNRKVIVPGKTLIDVSRIISGEMDNLVNIFFTTNHVVFEIPGTVVVSRLIDGDYFNIDQMISSDYETKLTINNQLLMGCVDRATLFVRENDKKPIVFDIGEDQLRLSIESPLGSMDEELDVAKEGKSFMIGFNPRFMMDALKAIDDEEVTLYLVNPKAPCFIRDEDLTYTYLVLPVNFVR